MTIHLKPVYVFLSYVREDEHILRQLDAHLSVLKQEGLISTWDAGKIVPGTTSSKVITEQLEQAFIIIFLLSADFLASSLWYDLAVKQALARHEAGLALVIPLIIRPVEWEKSPFAHLSPLPTNRKAITTWSNRDKAFVDVVSGLRRSIEEFLQSQPLSLMSPSELVREVSENQAPDHQAPITLLSASESPGPRGQQQDRSETSRKKSPILKSYADFNKKNRTPKFYYYISKQKVDMLLEQIQPEIPSLNEKGLITKASILIEKMEDKQLLRSMNNLDTFTFIQDKGSWHHGLVSFYYGSSKLSKPPKFAIISYILWKAYGDSLVLLVGSPNNILGEKVVWEGISVLGSNGQYFSLLNFIDESIKTDEHYAVKWTPEINGYEHMLEAPVAGPEMRLDFKEWIPMDHNLLVHGRFTALAVLCLKHLRNLPEIQTEITFKIFSKFELPQDKPNFFQVPSLRMLPPEVIHYLQERQNEYYLDLNVGKYKSIYVGSPIYTAIV